MQTGGQPEHSEDGQSMSSPLLPVCQSISPWSKAHRPAIACRHTSTALSIGSGRRGSGEGGRAPRAPASRPREHEQAGRHTHAWSKARFVHGRRRPRHASWQGCETLSTGNWSKKLQTSRGREGWINTRPPAARGSVPALPPPRHSPTRHGGVPLFPLTPPVTRASHAPPHSTPSCLERKAGATADSTIQLHTPHRGSAADPRDTARGGWLRSASLRGFPASPSAAATPLPSAPAAWRCSLLMTVRLRGQTTRTRAPLPFRSG